MSTEKKTTEKYSSKSSSKDEIVILEYDKMQFEMDEKENSSHENSCFVHFY